MAEQDTSNDLAQRLRDIALGMNAAANQATLREAAQRIEHHEMPWARLMKQAAGEDGVDSQAFLSRLWKKVEDQKRELAALNEKLRLAQEKQSTGNEPETVPLEDVARIAHWVLPSLRKHLDMGPECHVCEAIGELERYIERATPTKFPSCDCDARTHGGPHSDDCPGMGEEVQR